MKNFTKIFLAVVAGMFAFSCVNDTTEDAKVLVGSGVTEFTLSLEESKTQLGEKDTDGKYPLYWSQGDQISINGVPSIALSENYDGAVAATFSSSSAHSFQILTPRSCNHFALVSPLRNHNNS